MKTWQVLASAHRGQTPLVRATNGAAHPLEEELEQLALDKTPPQDRPKIESHLRDCEECRRSFEDALLAANRVRQVLSSQGRHDQRVAVRYKVRESAIVTRCDPPDFAPAIGQVMDVSTTGLRIRLEMPIHRGTQVQVQVEKAAVFGTVRYCREVSKNTYDVGLIIDQIVIRPGATVSEPADIAAKRPRFAKSKRHKTAAASPIEILVVEDNPADIKLIRLMFEGIQIPHRLTVVFDGAQALSHLFDLTIPRPDMVLLDLNLPKLGGVEVLRRLREDRTTESVTVVVLSSSTADADVRRTTGLGISAYLPKPDSIHRLEQMRRSLCALVSDLV